MARSAASIQLEIDALEAELQSSASLSLQSVSADGVSATRANRADLAKRLDQLYLQLARANGTAPMFTRGVSRGGMFT